jgi:hypothetical protein
MNVGIHSLEAAKSSMQAIEEKSAIMAKRPYISISMYAVIYYLACYG